jgi:NAD(P)-dependent dehydrogenase (short-subunit alcohol dehydrogenase family)
LLEYETKADEAIKNSAGYVSLSPLEETPPEDALKHYLINVHGPMLSAQAFVKLYLEFRDLMAVAIRDRKAPHGTKITGGRIVNIASQAGHVALHHHGAYCASKAGLLGLTRSMASEWGSKGITANSVSPGPVWTAMGKKAWADQKSREE